MRLIIKNTDKIVPLMQGKMEGRYSLYNVRESEDFYDFEFTDNQLHTFVHFKLNRNGEWNIDTRVWTYKFLGSPRYVTASWLGMSDNACWVLYKLLEEKL
mgnify:FL=1